MATERIPAGVSVAKKKDGTVYYRASLTCQRKHISLGSFDTLTEASRAYEEGNEILYQSRITIDSYDAGFAISHNKFVILLNFRDNHIYFGTPIYLGKRMFYYYFSPNEVFKFDMDDLFYYSSHKIQKRGKHFFVADYGSQISLLSRYQIFSYAVCGRDYEFVNQDFYDLRRENLLIKNKFRGVSVKEKGTSKEYIAKIHINSNFIIGSYSTPLEAAIAYNKAVDILRDNGCRKNFMMNYPEEVSAREYASIYSSLSISDKICLLEFKEP